MNAFIDKAKKAIVNCEMVIFSGSSPRFENPQDEIRIFGELIPYAKENDKFVLVDVYGNHLKEILKLKPDIVHTNLDELRTSLQLKIENEDNLMEKLKEFYLSGIKIFIITDGENKFFAINQGFLYEIIPPK